MSPVPGYTDSGVTARLFGTFLTWLNDRTSDSYVICTCNDISKLPPEFSRSERFDGIWFLDLPGREQKDAIWDIYLKMFELDADQARPKDDQWTGAEVRACCRLAALLDLPLTAAAQNVVPVAVTAAESVERLRQWASGRCLDAEGGGIYRRRWRGLRLETGSQGPASGPVEQLTAFPPRINGHGGPLPVAQCRRFRPPALTRRALRRLASPPNVGDKADSTRTEKTRVEGSGTVAMIQSTVPPICGFKVDQSVALRVPLLL